MTSIVEMVRHYQRSIEKSMENPSRLMHCIQKLNKLPITVEHLQETGVGKTVNNLRKYDGEVGYASKALVTKWKTMVATEEAENDSQEDEGQQEQLQEECHEDNDEEQDDLEENQLQIDETENIDPVVESSDEYNKEQRHTSSMESNHNNEHKHHKKSSKHSSDRKKHHSEHKSEKKHSHKDRDRSSGMTDKKESSREHTRHNAERVKEEKKSSKSSETKSVTNKTKHHSSSSRKDSHSSKKSNKPDTPNTSPKENGSQDETRDDEPRSKEHKSRSHDSKKSSKKDKDDSGKKRKRETSEIIIDSTMGASFADALGMLDMPSSSKSKKHLIERPSTSTAAPQPSTSSNNKKPSSSSNNTTTTRKLMEEPELLTKRPKLEPLPDIVADIPAPTITISTNYKPMPLNQTVMDCVFNQSSKPVRQMTEEEALTYSISSNKSRTKVFSGAKSGSRGKVESLFDLCIRVLQDYIDYLEYTGGVPFSILRPVLERATPEQLMTLEDYNPYLIEDSDCLWEQHCRRRFRGKRPEELESWREMFLRCLDEEQAKFKNLTENIKLARDKKLPVRKTKLAYVDSTVKPPRNVKSKQIKYGTDTLPNVTPASRVESLKNVGGNNASIGDRRLKIAAELRNSIPTHGPRINPNKKAPLMAKTLISMKKVFKR